MSAMGGGRTLTPRPAADVALSSVHGTARGEEQAGGRAVGAMGDGDVITSPFEKTPPRLFALHGPGLRLQTQCMAQFHKPY